MERSKPTRYSPELKVQAVRMAIKDGIGVAETARRLSISSKTLTNWVTHAKHPSQVFSEKTADKAHDAELRRLRKEKARLRMECEILQKATAYFAKESL